VEGRVDRGVIAVTSLLLLYGLVMVYSSSAAFSLRHYDNSFHLFLKQLIAAITGISLLTVLSFCDYHRLFHLDDLLLVGSFFLILLTVIPLSGATNGRWLQLGPLTLQPTELVKLSLVIYLAATISRKGEKISSFTDGVLPFVVVLSILGIVMINQPDFGMLVLFGALSMAMLFVSGARISHLAWLGMGSVPLIYVALRIAPYRLARIVSFLDPYTYHTSSGYQIVQSLVAIGSGGVIGRGLGASRAKLFYLPQAHNDFIFSIASEELGLIGALALIALFALFAWRAFHIALHASDRFGYLLAFGIGFTISMQALINLGVALGILPVTGLTLPFISNGGSSLVVTLAMVGTLLNISKQGGRP